MIGKPVREYEEGIFVWEYPDCAELDLDDGSGLGHRRLLHVVFTVEVGVDVAGRKDVFWVSIRDANVGGPATWKTFERIKDEHRAQKEEYVAYAYDKLLKEGGTK